VHSLIPYPISEAKRYIQAIATSLFANTFMLGIAFALLVCGASRARAQEHNFVVAGEGRTVVIEPYGPNIVRVTLSTEKEAASAPPGYGVIGKPAMTGWTSEAKLGEAALFRSEQLQVKVSLDQVPHRLPLDKLNQALRDTYFGGGHPRDGSFDDTLVVSTGDGKPLVTLHHWSMQPNWRTSLDTPGAAKQENPGYRISATFASPSDEHYYGLGQQQQGILDLRDHRINCWHDYSSVGGENVCVPFLISTAGYGLVWDNPSKTTVDLGFNQQNVWRSEIGDRVSFFVIAGGASDQIYEGYRLLTGTTHMLPRATYGYIQSKAIYPTQEELLAVAKGYRERRLPLDVLVVDFLNMTKQGDLDLDPARWPDPAAMNQQLHSMGIHSLLSVWPHFAAGTQFYKMLLDKGWLISDATGKPDIGGYKDVIGPNIDTTNAEAARWWWESIRDRYVKPYGFDYIWLDETEPDVDPAKDFFSIGSGARFYNVYPLFHTASVYDGFRRDFGDSRRVMILARAAYLGAQRNGTVFWSSDIVSTWDMLKRSIPAGLNFTASGMPYWDTDIAGFFSPTIFPDYHAAHPPLIKAPDAHSTIDSYEDYAELYVRWFEWGAFQPVMRSHGERDHNEVWSYGKEAEAVLAKYLRLRYQMLPYIYSLGYKSYQTGAPFMRALFMDFPHDPKVTNIVDEYMFGPAFLVAPVTEQGATSRQVYLPAGCDWYNYWTNERLKGGQTITASAPIDTLPLFVRAGSIVPLGSEVLSTQDQQAIKSVRVYPGADADFTLFSDDGTTYSYEKGRSSITRLHWDDAKQRLTHQGSAAWKVPDEELVQVAGH
jgi:alpha-D-xyloside xylohydrolase